MGRGTGWGWLKDAVGPGAAAIILAIAFAYLSFPHRKASQRAYSKAETRPYPEKSTEMANCFCEPLVFCPHPFTPIAFHCQLSGHSWILPALDKVLRCIVLLSWN